MKKKKLLKLFIVVFATCLLVLPFSHKAFSSSKVKYNKIVVYPGDTLWSIAAENNTDNSDVRKLVYEIKKINKLSSPIIQPGQELLIPADQDNSNEKVSFADVF